MNPKSDILIYLIFIALGFLLTIPAFHQGMLVSHDILIYSNWHNCFSDQFLAGEWYPRWLIDMNGGRGSPVFFFYPPLPFYISSFFEYFIPDHHPKWYALYYSIGLALGLSGVTCYTLLKNYTQQKYALFLSLFYILAPFHLLVNFYQRFSYPEIWAFTWTPLIFYFAREIFHNQKKATIGLSISYALLLITHIPTILIITPLLSIYPTTTNNYVRNLLYVSISMIYGILMSSFYIFPMIFYQKYISLDKMWEGSYSLYNHFLSFGKGINNNFFLGLCLINLFVIIICTIIIKQKNNDLVFWILSGLLSIFMMFEISSFIWQSIPLISKIQFPWRLNQITLIAIIVLVSSILNYSIYSINNFASVLKLFVIVILILQVASVFIRLIPFKIEELSYKQIERVSRETKAKVGVVEYLPRWSSNQTVIDIHHRKLNKLDKRFNISGAGQIRILKWFPRDIEMQGSSNNGFTVTINQFYLPLWKIRINNAKNYIEAIPGENGMIQVSIPPGNHIITLKLVEGAWEVSGKIVSLLALLLLFIYFPAKVFLQKEKGINKT
jgi:hypothetical protein